MAFDFNEHIDRTNFGSIKWSFPSRSLKPAQAKANPLPLWIADTDFLPPPAVTDALRQALDKGILGYSLPKPTYFEAVQNWQKKRFNWQTEDSWIVQTPGVVTALNIAVQAFTQAGDSVLIQPPVYSHFRDDMEANGRHVVSAPLKLGSDGRYTFDADEFEAAIRPDTRMFILCNPHNPTGNVWTEAELRTMGAICLRHDLIVISDEIHQDLIFNREKKHIAFASLGSDFSENSVTCTAPSKTFNLAGMQISNIFIPNVKLRQRFTRQMHRNGINLVNQLGMIACEAAYRNGEAWLEALLNHIQGNQDYLAKVINCELPILKITPTDALYLSWVDFRLLNMNSADLMDFLTTKAKVWFNNGASFSREGEGFMRINVGCTRSTLEEAIRRLRGALICH